MNQPTLELRAGGLTLEFEPASAMIRNVCSGGDEVLRGIYGAVRDADWNTAPAVIKLRDQHIGRDHFRIEFDALCHEGTIDFAWRGVITGDAQGTVTYEFDGEPQSSFLRNRIGLCVLHPALGCEGRPCRVETVDDETLDLAFPTLIAPWQPFRRVRAISYPCDDHQWLTTRFEGDEFETEDQRNWSDASFKTYSTPLARPFPVLVTPGMAIRQVVTVQLEPRPATAITESSTSRPKAPSGILAVGPSIQLPALGMLAEPKSEFTESDQAALRVLSLDHLRVDLTLDDNDWTQRLGRTRALAAKAGASLHLALHGSAQALLSALDDVRSLLSREEATLAPVTAAMLFPDDAAVTPAEVLSAARRALPPTCQLVAGTNAYLAELNRERPAPGVADAISFGLTPQVHAGDTRTIVESLEVQARMVETVREFVGDAPVMVSPVTLLPRFNPVATSKQDGAAGDRSTADPRQGSVFLAGWTLASVAQLARGGAASVTYFACLGPRGVVTGAGESRHAARVTPVYHVFADLAEIQRGTPIAVRALSTGPGWRAIHGLGARLERGTVVLLANQGDVELQTRLPAEFRPRSTGAKIRLLDESSRQAAAADPETYRANAWRPLASDGAITLPPWAYARIDFQAEG